MFGWRRLALTLTLSALLAAALQIPAAYADGDPASDVLVSQDVFLPPSANVSARIATQLKTLTRQAARAGDLVKVALIAAPTDLGSVSSLYGRPTDYARFLSLELEFVTRAPILIVMPQGISVAHAGKTLPHKELASIPVTAGPTGLAHAALTAIHRLEPDLKAAPSTKPHATTHRPPTPRPGRAESTPTARSHGAGPADAPGAEPFGHALGDRFITGAQDPVVWFALGVTAGFVALAAGAIYLATEWAMRRSGRLK
jgi:hypothetical protein